MRRSPAGAGLLATLTRLLCLGAGAFGVAVVVFYVSSGCSFAYADSPVLVADLNPGRVLAPIVVCRKRGPRQHGSNDQRARKY